MIELYWREPLWFIGLVLPFVLALVARRQETRRLTRLIDPHLLPWTKRGSNPDSFYTAHWVLSLSWGLCIIALAGPRSPLFIPNGVLPPQEQVLFIQDHSPSMKANDVILRTESVSRIQAANDQIDRWLSESSPSALYGQMVFSGDVHWIVKPTFDVELVRHFIQQSHQLTLPTIGNNVAGALAQAFEFAEQYDQPVHLVLFSDGDIDEAQHTNARTALSALDALNNVHLWIIGVGGQELANVPTLDGLSSRLDSASLNALADTHSSVSYVPFSQLTESHLGDVLSITPARIPSDKFNQVVWQEWFTLPLLLAMLMISGLMYPLKRRYLA